ncbi:fatty acid desaturase [Achromobacter sp.]|uniref:fatty acid desaturase n=1 Tax=Achromobacter sp. TaxID=134375 RepID=UPI0028B1E050|nr:fatty acid desaturase [Achromobacter sp.]
MRSSVENHLADGRSPRRRLPSLRNWRDWQSLAYLAALPALAAWQWVHGFWWPLYLLMLFLTLGIGVIHHNHTHIRMWRGRWTNRATDFWITLLQGHPTFVFYPAHVANHHRFKHGARDVARTYRFGGDTNHLWGYLVHPLQAGWVLYPLFFAWLARLRRHCPGAWRYCMAQYGVWLGLWGGLLAVNPVKALVFVIVPQLHGLHWLLATNYLQHADADGGPRGVAGLNYARNFEGLVNPLLFNIGLHTAHHEHPRAHWSDLTRLHREHYRQHVDPALNEGGLAPYMFRVFVLGTFLPRFRSRSCMAPEHIR